MKEPRHIGDIIAEILDGLRPDEEITEEKVVKNGREEQSNYESE